MTQKQESVMKQESVIKTSGLRPLTDDQLNAVNGGIGPIDGVRFGPVDGVRLGPVDGFIWF